MGYILYIKIMFVCLFVCMFVCTLYKSTFVNRSEPNFGHGPHLGLEKTVGYVWALNSGPLRPFGPFFLSGHKMADGTTVFRDTVISVVPAGVRVTSPSLPCRWRWSYPRQSYIRDSTGSSPYAVADDRVIRHSVLSLILVGVCVTSRILRSTGRRAHPPQRYIPHSCSCFCGLQEITSLQTTVARFYSKCVALSVMRTIRWDVNGIYVSTIPNLIRREESD
jgi:hypothetical protein